MLPLIQSSLTPISAHFLAPFSFPTRHHPALPMPCMLLSAVSGTTVLLFAASFNATWRFSLSSTHDFLESDFLSVSFDKELDAGLPLIKSAVLFKISVVPSAATSIPFAATFISRGLGSCFNTCFCSFSSLFRCYCSCIAD